MANREKGEATFQIDTKTYTLRIDLHAWALAQDALTIGDRVPDFDLIVKRLYAGHALSMVAAFWAGMQKYHASDVKDLRQASSLMEKSGGAASKALLQAVNSASPDPQDLEELGVTANPPKAQDATAQVGGTGEKSVSEPAVPA